MTFFAVDAADSQRISNSLTQAIASQPDLVWMALVDGAFDAEDTGFISWEGAPPVALHQDRTAVGTSSGPYLLTLPVGNADALSDALARLLDHCSGRPMLSFIASAASAEGLRDIWAPGMEVDSAGEGQFVLRFADTRVLPAMSDASLRGVWQVLAAPIQHWFFVDRQGGLGRLLLTGEPAGSADAEAEAILTEQGLEVLLTAGLPDAVIDIVADQLPELLPETDRAAFYDRVNALCRLGRENGVDSLRDMVALVTIGLMTEGGLIKDPRFYAILAAKSYTPGALMEELVTLLE